MERQRRPITEHHPEPDGVRGARCRALARETAFNKLIAAYEGGNAVERGLAVEGLKELFRRMDEEMEQLEMEQLELEQRQLRTKKGKRYARYLDGDTV
jgi:hypothetical protein